MHSVAREAKGTGLGNVVGRASDSCDSSNTGGMMKLFRVSASSAEDLRPESRMQEKSLQKTAEQIWALADSNKDSGSHREDDASAGGISGTER